MSYISLYDLLTNVLLAKVELPKMYFLESFYGTSLSCLKHDSNNRVNFLVGA